LQLWITLSMHLERAMQVKATTTDILQLRSI